MNTASLELCKELYELSGWTKTHSVWHDDTAIDPIACGYEDIEHAIHFVPAYDLGYLLRKLPPKLEGHHLTLSTTRGKNEWGIWYESWALKTGFNRNYTDTPEDAAAKLAIELFKQGVLK